MGTATSSPVGFSVTAVSKTHPAVVCLVGDYKEAGVNHGRKYYKRVGKIPGHENVSVFLYYWDARDGDDFQGWWFGNVLGGAQVWARARSCSYLPPCLGWKIPYDSPKADSGIIRCSPVYQGKPASAAASGIPIVGLACPKRERRASAAPPPPYYSYHGKPTSSVPPPPFCGKLTSSVPSYYGEPTSSARPNQADSSAFRCDPPWPEQVKPASAVPGATVLLQDLVARLQKAQATADAATGSAADAAAQAESAKAAAKDAAAQAEIAKATSADAAAKARAAAEALAALLLQADSTAKAAAEAENASPALNAGLAQSVEGAAWQLLSYLPSEGLEESVRQQVLPARDARHAMISKLLTESCSSHRRALGDPTFCPPPNLILTEVALVCNPGLAEDYRRTKRRIHQRRSAHGCHELQVFQHLSLPSPDGCEKNQLNEVLLFHGAPSEAVEKICQEGFDPRRGGEAVAATFGIGTYFAANASKADIYTERLSGRLPKHAARKLIVARVLLGAAYRATNSLKGAPRPPDGPDGRPYDSVWADTRANGGAVDHPEAIIYDRGQAVPLLVVTYRHSDSCECAECGKRSAK